MTGKQVEQANNLGRIANMAGQMDPVGDVQTQRFFADHLAFGPSPTITNCHGSGRPAKREPAAAGS
jgi:hypothetical protein